jgi:CrcB protein
VLLVMLGAAVGAPLRYLTDRFVQRRHDTVFPLGTFAVNVTGSLLLGLLTGLSVSPRTVALVGTGFCGALTTYSTFGYETMRLVEDGALLFAAANVVFTVLAGLAAAAGGYAVGVQLGPA